MREIVDNQKKAYTIRILGMSSVRNRNDDGLFIYLLFVNGGNVCVREPLWRLCTTFGKRSLNACGCVSVCVRLCARVVM